MRGKKPSLREQVAKSEAAMKFLCGGTLPANLQKVYDAGRPAPKRERMSPNPENAEAGVMQDVADLLRLHPQVLFAVRQNAGAMAYEDKAGHFRPIWFYQWVRQPRKMRITDFWGYTRDGKPFAIEAKRRDWKTPNGQREEEQEAFLDFIRSLGGRSGFARNVDEAKRIIEG